MIKRIPNRNHIFEYEKKYLEEKHREGFKLKRRGLIFYTFERVTPGEAVYEMDLACKGLSDCQLQACDWELLTKRRTLFRKLKKVYYYSQDTEARLLVDEQLRLEYYKFKRAAWWVLLVAWPFVTIFGGGMLLYDLAPDFFDNWLSSSIFVMPYIYYKALPFTRGINFLNEKLGNETIMWHHFTIHFTGLTDEQHTELSQTIRFFGLVAAYAKKGEKDYVLLKTRLTNTALLEQEIMNSAGLRPENLLFIHKASIAYNTTGALFEALVSAPPKL
ncbi:MAG: DUF2812 domain-containing protein [Turicibacter sp.]|nr:DUF2812 domain-containing protein [Turicibacter sp.]